MKNWNQSSVFFDGHYGGSWGTDYFGYRIVEMYKSGQTVTYQVNPQIEPPVNKNLI
jgi:hypothetical protein